MFARSGQRVARLITDSMVEHMRKTSQVRARIAAEGANEFFRGMSREKRQHTAKLWEMFLGGEHTPPELETALEFIAHGQGELSELMGTLGLGQVVGSSIFSGIENALAPINQAWIAADPNGLLDPASAAAADVRGIENERDYAAEAAKFGLGTNRYNVMRLLSYQYPAAGEALTLLRRGFIDEAEAAKSLERNAVPPALIPALLKLKDEPLSPADAALATIRGLIPEAEGAAKAAHSGVNGEDFKLLVGNTGTPPGLEQMLEGYRRKFISDAELRKGIRQSRVRDEWIPLVEKLRFEPASAADAIDAVVQHHLPEAKARDVCEQNGLEPEDFDWLLENAGEPAATMQMLSLLNRGKVTQEQVEQAIREGHVKDKYISAVLNLRVKLPTVFEVVKLVESGKLSTAEGSRVLLEQGYPDDLVVSIVGAAHTEKTSKAKHLAEVDITELYHDLAITDVEATEYLKVLGFDGDDAKLILAVVDLKRERTLKESAAGQVRASFVANHITETEAGGMLDKLKVAAAQKAFYLQLWEIERDSTRKGLSEAQVNKANELGLLTDVAAEQRLVDMGYTREDAKLLLDLQKAREKPAP